MTMLYDRRDVLKEIQVFSKAHHLQTGICSPDPLQLPAEDMSALSTPYPFSSTRYSVADRLQPEHLLRDVRSILVVGLSCFRQTSTPLKVSPGKGRLSFLACGHDYHQELTDLLCRLAERLNHITPLQYKIHVDNGPLIEKQFAVQAGLGFIGRMGLVISPVLGSFFNIGLLLTTLDLPPSTPTIRTGCGGCRLCSDSCPNHIPGSIQKRDMFQCISWLTQQKNGSLTGDQLHGWLYGCDLCQLSCPYNRHLTGAPIGEEEILPDLSKLLSLSNAALKKQYGRTSAGWRLDCIKRNAQLILNHNNSGKITITSAKET